MGERMTFKLIHSAARHGAVEAIKRAPDGYVCEVRPAKRSLDQNARFHAMLSDIAKSGAEVCGKPRDLDDLKVLFVSAWRAATKQPGEVVMGIEGEPVQLRRSTTSLSVKEMADLITYVDAWAATRGIELRDT
jgi:hypothetical protein